MCHFLFWNLNKKPLEENIKRLATGYEIDVMMFAEMSSDPNDILKALNSNNRADFFYIPNIGEGKIHIFTRFSSHFIKPVYDESRLTIRQMILPGLTGILLAVVHFPSKVHWDDESQSQKCVEMSQTIKDVENRIGHSRTVLVGDLNMNPFESGMVGSHGFHGVMSRDIARKGSRKVDDRDYPFFYNPMWGLFGDRTAGVPGSYYYNSSKPVQYFWNMFDQVLLRPDLMDRFSEEDLKLIDSDGEVSFLSSGGIPRKDVLSDHLPIFFKIQL